MVASAPAPLAVPVMSPVQPVAGDWSVLPSWLPVPGMGVLAANSFLLRGRQPMLVDTGLLAVSDAYIAALTEAIDPADLRWIWISHLDADHVGNLDRVTALAPNATVLTSFLGAGKMQVAGMDASRVQTIEPGTRIDLGDRELVPLRPPYYDAPETLGFFDLHDRVLFAADAFGAVLPDAAERHADIPRHALAEGLRNWSSLDAPWLSQIDPRRFAASLAAVGCLTPLATLTGHLPPVTGDLGPLLEDVHDAWCRPAAADPALMPFSLESALAAVAAGSSRAAGDARLHDIAAPGASVQATATPASLAR